MSLHSMSLTLVSSFCVCLICLCLKRFINSIKGISFSSSEVSLSYLYFLANFDKGTFSSGSESDSVPESEG